MYEGDLTAQQKSRFRRAYRKTLEVEDHDQAVEQLCSKYSDLYGVTVAVLRGLVSEELEKKPAEYAAIWDELAARQAVKAQPPDHANSSDSGKDASGGNPIWEFENFVEAEKERIGNYADYGPYFNAVATPIDGSAYVTANDRSKTPRRPRSSSILIGCALAACVLIALLFIWVPMLIIYLGGFIVIFMISAGQDRTSLGLLLYPMWAFFIYWIWRDPTDAAGSIAYTLGATAAVIAALSS